MDIKGLGYLVLESTEADQWPAFARDLLGMDAALDDDASVVLRLDERAARLIVVPGQQNRLRATGLELVDRAACERAVEELRAEGYEVQAATESEAARRRVGGYASVADPSGNTVELFYSPLLVTEPRASRLAYKTGSLGLGHVVLPAQELEQTVHFYVELLGFRHRDTIRPALDGHEPVTLHFLGCNPRHHTVALAGHSDPRGMRHFMLEVQTLAEMGRVYDRALAAERLFTHLGQHSNDQGLSFYLHCPGGAILEFGTGCLVVDDATWSAREMDAAGFWGHQLLGR